MGEDKLNLSRLPLLSVRPAVGDSESEFGGGSPHTAIRGNRCRTYSGGRSIPSTLVSVQVVIAVPFDLPKNSFSRCREGPALFIPSKKARRLLQRCEPKNTQTSSLLRHYSPSVPDYYLPSYHACKMANNDVDKILAKESSLFNTVYSLNSTLFSQFANFALGQRNRTYHDRLPP